MCNVTIYTLHIIPCRISHIKCRISNNLYFLWFSVQYLGVHTKGIFKGKERKALEAKIKDTETEIADRLDKIPDTLKEDGYPDVQVFMRTFREMESVVEQYNRDLAEWEYQVSRKPTATAKEQHRPPEKQSVLKHLREIQERNKQKPPQRQRKKSIDRDSR